MCVRGVLDAGCAPSHPQNKGAESLQDARMAGHRQRLHRWLPTHSRAAHSLTAARRASVCLVSACRYEASHAWADDICARKGAEAASEVDNAGAGKVDDATEQRVWIGGR